tara:strand:+ start:418 stop:1698 length:1281 start_codon:yes stop_codon:yes gene_type:complete
MPGKVLSEVLKLLGDGVNKEDFARKWALSEVSLPACVRSTVEGGCMGLMKDDGLYTQCTQRVCKNGFCKRCMNSFVEEGMPRLGLWSVRLKASRVGNGEWKTTDGKEALSWASYLRKKKLTRADGEEVLRMNGIDSTSIPEHEWVLPVRGRRGRVRAVSDTSSEGERTTIRFLPLEGKKKSPKKDEAHIGTNGKMLRVCVYQESKVVTKVNPGNWTDEAHAKFAEMYCEGRTGEDEGKEFGKSTKRKKKDAAASQLAEMQAQMEAMKKEYEAQLAAARESKKDGNHLVMSSAIEEEKKDETEALAEKKRKEAAVKKMRAEKKAKAEAEKKRKAEAEKKAKADAEKKAKAEELKKQLAALEAEQEHEQEDELGEFDDSDDEGQEFNPYEHDGVTYHRDEEDKLYTEDGDYWGYINDNGEAVEGDEEE